MDNFSEDTQNLFLEINPNIDEIAKEEEEMNEDAELEEKEMVISEEKNKHEDVFEDTKPVVKKKKVIRKKVEKKVRFEEPEPEPEHEPEPEPTVEESQGDDTLPMTYRQKKKLETAKRKADEKEAKRIAKEKHREEMKEKNRAKARERYWKQKQVKDKQKKEQAIEVPKKIVQETKSQLNGLQKKEVDKKVNNNLDFATFSSYMMKYEEMKHHISKQKEEELKQKQREKQEQQQAQSQASHSFYPANYPVHLLYGRKKSNKNILW